MSLGLKGRNVFLAKHYRADRKTMHGVITKTPIWVSVRLESGNIVDIEESNVYFDRKKKGKGK